MEVTDNNSQKNVICAKEGFQQNAEVLLKELNPKLNKIAEDVQNEIFKLYYSNKYIRKPDYLNLKKRCSTESYLGQPCGFTTTLIIHLAKVIEK